MGFWRRLNDRLFNFPLRLRFPMLPLLPIGFPQVDVDELEKSRRQLAQICRSLEQELEIDYGPAPIDEPTPGELAARARKLFNARGGA